MPDDPMQVLIVELPDGPERAEALRLFQLTAPSSVRVHSICRVQNLALWYSFVVKRQTMLMREKSLPNAAVEHYEQRLFHGCPAHLVDRIAQDALTPAVRYENQLYDSTVDDVQRPSIYATYNDAQVHPDILIKFSQ